MRLIFPTILLVISAIIFFVVIDPTYGEVKQLRTEVSTYNAALNNSAELQKARDALLEDYKNIKAEDKERLNHFLPNTISNIELILEIEKIASLHGMPIRDIKFESKTEDKAESVDGVVAEVDPTEYLPYGIFPMEFVIEGRYETFLSFLEDLEHNLRLVDIKSISFNVPDVAVGSTTNPNIFSYTLKIETYWIK